MRLKIALVLILILIFSGCSFEKEKVARGKEGVEKSLQVEYVVKGNSLSYIKKSQSNIITDDLRLLPNYPQDKNLVFTGNSKDKNYLFFKEKDSTSSPIYVLDIKNIQKGFKRSK